MTKVPSTYRLGSIFLTTCASPPSDESICPSTGERSSAELIWSANALDPILKSDPRASAYDATVNKAGREEFTIADGGSGRHFIAQTSPT
jgi:hypothetical protein